jgi:hypothetical protein
VVTNCSATQGASTKIFTLILGAFAPFANFTYPLTVTSLAFNCRLGNKQVNRNRSAYSFFILQQLKVSGAEMVSFLIGGCLNWLFWGLLNNWKK